MESLNEQPDQSIELTELEPLEPTEPKSKGGRKLGSKNLPKIDYDQRIESLISAMNALIEKGELTATVERAYNRQIEYFQFQIQRRDDAKKESRERELAKIKELEAQPPAPPVPVPPAPAVDVETERRLANLLKQLQTPEPEKAEVAPAPVVDEAVERRAKEAAEKKAAEELEKKLADDKRLARIAELREAWDDIIKARNNPGTMLAGATNPTFLRDGNRALKEIAAELQQLENPNLVTTAKRPEFDHDAYDRRQAEQEERELTARMLEGEQITAANRATARPAPISGGLGMCEGPEWNR